MALASIQSWILATIAAVFEDEEEQNVIESVRTALNLPKIVPEVRLSSTRVSKKNRRISHMPRPLRGVEPRPAPGAGGPGDLSIYRL